MALQKRWNFALVGCGRISEQHFNALQQHSGRSVLTDVCDSNPQALSVAVARTQANGHSTLEALLAHSTAEVIVLCTPSGLHASQTLQIAAQGRHVVTEKPMATRWRDGVRMVEACDRAGTRLFVVKQNRRNVTLQLLKQAIDQKRFGRLYMANVNVFWSRPQAYYDAAKWRGTWEFDGGALMNQASHYVDLLDWLVGPVESVQAFTATLARSIEVEDTAVMSVRWRSGTLGSLNVTMLVYPQNFEGAITLIGEKGTVRIGGVAINTIEHWEFETPNSHDVSIKRANYDAVSVYGFGHVGYYENVLDVLDGVAEPETDGREGLRSLELLIAAYRAARDGRRVCLPLDY